MNITPVILSGGHGTRMWPLSRSSMPKQFLALCGEQTLLQQTVLRAGGVANACAPIIISNSEQRFLVAEQLREVGVTPSEIVLEPVGRNTAPAVAVAALLAAKTNPDALLLVLPSDHVIQNVPHFQTLVHAAAQLAEQNHLVTFGIQPTEPHTGYGYILRGATLNPGCFQVDAFVEKPNAQRAAEYLATGQYYWNSGMFLFKAAVYLQELASLHPDILAQVQLATERAQKDLDFLRLDPESFAACSSESIDYAVMEKTQAAAVVEAIDLGWSDIGSWTALAEVSPQDAAGNNLVGDVLVEDVADCYIRAESHMVAALGVSGLVIVDTPDAVLVVRKDRVQDVKKIVDRLNAQKRPESILHRQVYRPWGSYERLDMGERYQVKHIVVKPGGVLSLQKHHHRAEHWIVVKGTALITCGEKELLLTENQSTYIPLGEIHRLENPGRMPLELIEVQSGSYLGEDDIVRLEDTYGRA